MNRRLLLLLAPALVVAQAPPPDFSWAGYHSGEAPIPRAAANVSVRDFGAAGDGVKDDTSAFLKAIEEATGVIRVPAGRYRITGILEIERSGVVLRGDGPDRTTLFFPTPLNDIRPNWGATTGGQRTSNYSWAGGFIWLKGSFGNKRLARVTSESKRGAQELTLSSTDGLRTGQKVQIVVRDDEAKTLSAHLYSDDPGDMSKITSTRTQMISRIVKIDGSKITLERPLRFDIRASWQPEVLSFEPTVTESGIEDMRFEFPAPEYKGHFTELGFNPVAFTNVADCWIRNIRLTNPDSGPFITGSFNTVDGIVYESSRAPEKRGFNGHHGVYFGGEDNLFTNFDFQMKFIHDLSVSHAAGNVFSNGKGLDVSFDHHKHAPYENLFTNIDVGAGTRPWMSGGGDALGRHCAARGTFWNIRAAAPLKPPPAGWAPSSVILSGLAPEVVQPANLHADQLARRLRKK